MNVSSLNTFIQIFVFFFTYFPFIKALTLDNNIVSLLDFWLYFFEHRATATPLALILSFFLALFPLHIYAHMHTRTLISLSLSLSFFLEKYFMVYDRPVFHALLDSNV